MKVFLSWSGKVSLAVAEALRDWLPGVLQAVEPWLSSEDIPLGDRWANLIGEILESAEVGIICLTKENLNSQWLNFEAGAISKKFRQSLVCVYTLNISPSEISGPLSQFQCASTNRDDTYRLVSTLNNSLGESAVPEKYLERSFNLNWPFLQERLEEIIKSEQNKEKDKLHIEDKIDELLNLVRALSEKDIQEEVEHHEVKLKAKGKQKSSDIKVEKPRVFIGSSSESLHVAEAIQLGLEHVAECTIWSQSTFGLSSTTIESIVDAALEFDYAVLVLTPDDMVTKRGEALAAPRDNIIFELGLFTGILGRARTFMVYNRDSGLHLPSDLAGVTAATYSDRADNNIEAALGPVCTRIKRAMGVDDPWGGYKIEDMPQV
jgi:predicted nucleotide-binding protein